MEYIHGEPFEDTLDELSTFFYLKILDILTKNQVMFYTGCVVSAINYLHERKIIYRDLKPENLITGKDVIYLCYFLGISCSY